jgi:hypothetical protein
MSAERTTEKHPERSQTDEPAKGGTKPARRQPFRSGDSPKPHGDKLEHAVDETSHRANKK